MDSKERELKNACAIALKNSDNKAAFDTCNRFIAENPLSSYGLRQRAALHARTGDFKLAIESMDAAIRISPDESQYYFFRGWWHLELGNYMEAAIDQTRTLESANKQESHYFDESALFFRALAWLRLRRFEDAILDSERVRDDFLIYLKSIGKVTKADIVNEARSHLNRGPSA